MIVGTNGLIISLLQLHNNEQGLKHRLAGLTPFKSFLQFKHFIEILTLNATPPTNIRLGMTVPYLGAFGALGTGEDALELVPLLFTPSCNK